MSATCGSLANHIIKHRLVDTVTRHLASNERKEASVLATGEGAGSLPDASKHGSASEWGGKKGPKFGSANGLPKYPIKFTNSGEGARRTSDPGNANRSSRMHKCQESRRNKSLDDKSLETPPCQAMPTQVRRGAPGGYL